MAKAEIIPDDPKQDTTVQPGAAYVDNDGDIRIFDTSHPTDGHDGIGLSYVIDGSDGKLLGTLLGVYVGEKVPDGWRRFRGSVVIDFSED